MPKPSQNIQAGALERRRTVQRSVHDQALSSSLRNWVEVESALAELALLVHSDWADDPKRGNHQQFQRDMMIGCGVVASWSHKYPDWSWNCRDSRNAGQGGTFRACSSLEETIDHYIRRHALD